MKFAIFFASLIALSCAQDPIGPGVPDERCPPGTTDPPTHLNDPSNCSNFFTCANGLAVPFRCPEGQHWSTALNRCDWPAIAQCEDAKPSDCPADDPFPPIMLPHPSDCSRFFKCSWGQPIEMNCPPGQHWDSVRDFCDWPDRANCEGSS